MMSRESEDDLKISTNAVTITVAVASLVLSIVMAASGFAKDDDAHEREQDDRICAMEAQLRIGGKCFSGQHGNSKGD